MDGFAERLEEARARSGLSKKALAGRAGVSLSYLSFLTSGARRNPSLDVARRLAACLGVGLDWLYRGEGAYAALVHVPILGVVPAPHSLPADASESTAVPVNIAPRRPDYAVWVGDDAMAGDGIRHGDLVFVRRQPLADAGQIVVADLDGRVVLKRFGLGADAFVLEPGSIPYDPLRTRDTRILGVYVGRASSA